MIKCVLVINNRKMMEFDDPIEAMASAPDILEALHSAGIGRKRLGEALAHIMEVLGACLDTGTAVEWTFAGKRIYVYPIEGVDIEEYEERPTLYGRAYEYYDYENYLYGRRYGEVVDDGTISLLMQEVGGAAKRMRPIEYTQLERRKFTLAEIYQI